ncbi:hypothetical protein SALBM311S_02236 [Streptomyces alboniger]
MWPCPPAGHLEPALPCALPRAPHFPVPPSGPRLAVPGSRSLPPASRPAEGADPGPLRSGAPCRRCRSRAPFPRPRLSVHPGRPPSARVLNSPPRDVMQRPAHAGPGRRAADWIRSRPCPYSLWLHERLGQRRQRVRRGGALRCVRRDGTERRPRDAATPRGARRGGPAVPVRGGRRQDPVRRLGVGRGAHRDPAGRRCVGRCAAGRAERFTVRCGGGPDPVVRRRWRVTR